ncbi:MAG: glycosyltransferase family 4 protein [Nitrospirota bacterium]|nr:glycosyltransferase family 4 protein [Nitrospirota bacterium]
MKIIHVSPTYAPVLGGAELHMKALSEGLVSRGHDVTVLTANARSSTDLFRGIHGRLTEAEVINGVNVVRFDPNGQVLGAWLKRWIQLPGGCRSLRIVFGEDGMEMLAAQPQLIQIMSYLLRTRADVVMAMSWYWSPAYHTYLARQLRDFVFVGIPLFHTAETWCQRPIYRNMLASSNAIVANTTHEEQFARAYGARRVEVGGVGVYPDGFVSRNGAAIRARYGIGSAPVVGFVGRQEVNKGVVQLVHAMKIVWRWNAEVRLIIAGHQSSEHQARAVQSAIEQLTGSEQRRLVRISQFEEAEKSSLYDAFDIFALPSIGESFGLAYLEAWLCQKPVIGARIGSTECVIDDGVDGLLVDPQSPDDLAEKIITLLSDRDKRVQMGMAGYSKTLARYTWDKVVDRVEALYRDLHAVKGATNARSAIYGDASGGSQV